MNPHQLLIQEGNDIKAVKIFISQQELQIKRLAVRSLHQRVGKRLISVLQSLDGT